VKIDLQERKFACTGTLFNFSLARAIGPAGFATALAEECCNLALNLIEKHDDPGESIIVSRKKSYFFRRTTTLLNVPMNSTIVFFILALR
jgi:hypothetical protein